MPVEYEWDVEEMDGDEIVDHHFCGSFAEAKEVAADGDPDSKWVVVLVCKVEDYNRGLTHTSWAYLREDGTLPADFTDAGGRPTRKVPKKFHSEIVNA
jgi:hypothetical protein